MKRALYIAAGVSVLFLISATLFLKYAFSPTPDSDRNNEVNQMRLEVVAGDDKRLPIVRTFLKQDYGQKSKEQKEKIRNLTGGRVEGDIPCISLEEDNKLYFSFRKEGNKISTGTPPKIELQVNLTGSGGKKEAKTIKDVVAVDGHGNYFYELKRYTTQYEKYFMEFVFVTLSYDIEGEEYVSVFSIYSSNAEDGERFFDNETLQDPLPAED